MKWWHKLKKVLALATICASSGCSAYQIFAHPYDNSRDFFDSEKLKKRELNIEQRMTLKPQGKKIPPGGDLDGRLKLDAYCFYNRFYARLNQRMNERIYIDLQDSRISDFYYAGDEISRRISVRKGHKKYDNYGDLFETEFTADLYGESQKIAAKSIRDSLKDLELYEVLRPFFEFNIKKDTIPFTDKKIVEGKESGQKTQLQEYSLDEFDERIANPHKVPEQELNEAWLINRLTDASLGINLNYDLFKAGKDFGIEPYVKWMDILRWTYNTKNLTIEHKLSFPVYNAGIGFSAETNEQLTRIDKLNASIGYSINRKTSISISGFKKYYDSDGQKEDKDEGMSISFFWRF